MDLVFITNEERMVPKDWLLRAGAHVHVLDGETLPKPPKSGGGPFIILRSGVRAAEAARLVAQRIRPKYVVHIGAANATGNIARVPWEIADELANGAGASIPIDYLLPFRFPGGIGHHLGRREDDYLFSMAAAFRESGASFHAITRSVEREADFAAARDELKTILGFLDGPGEADISAVIPVYNRAGSVGRSVESVLRQTLPPREVIVVDDGSTDSTADVLKQFGGDIRVTGDGRNRGVAAARNLGVAQSSGAWIAFNDSDDVWEPDKLERQWDYLRANPYYEFIHGYDRWIYDGAEIEMEREGRKPEGWIWKASLGHCYISPPTVLMKRALFDELGGFDESLPVSEDYEFWLRLSRNHPVGLCSHVSTNVYGGAIDQISQRYRNWERYRVAALIKAWRTERSAAFRAMMEAEMRAKLEWLIGEGSAPGDEDAVMEYRGLLAALDDGNLAAAAEDFNR